jgi:hypothetical protein
MVKNIVERFGNEIKHLNKDEIEDTYPIDQAQLSGAKIFASREIYTEYLPKNIRYMEVGVAWGYYSEFVCEHTNPVSVDFVDRFNQDMKCWSWRRTGECQCSPKKHEYLFTAEESEQYIKDLFAKYNNVTTHKGNAEYILPNLNKEFDYIYIDTHNGREHIRKLINSASKLVPVGGIIGFNDYTIYDGIIDDVAYGTFQSINEFLHYNKNWTIDALALHRLGFYDIYIKRVS